MSRQREFQFGAPEHNHMLSMAHSWATAEMYHTQGPAAFSTSAYHFGVAGRKAKRMPVAGTKKFEGPMASKRLLAGYN